ncbi:uncharacterized protein LOC6542935 [Drosophila erecta]|uniref:Uncharacterized protein n=1 Tax=Drosophila erecta TaxID=7220 RepID=B3N632_DROER|nr:uncharacterized protein LOC6542935 [Drosophila erecta]EDV58070.2 uncharacterized protein Dere_GG25182 [Drosophila erecta]
MPKLSRQDSISINLSNSSVTFEDDQFENPDEAFLHKGFFSLSSNLSRVQSVMLDYKQFKAARTIQRYFLGWIVREHLRKLKLAAIVIQKWWRRFAAQRNLLYVAERALQSATLAHYERSATVIQTLYRGWWSRKHIFDLTMLKSVQNALATDLIHTLVKYLHSTKNSELLPGVYTVRDSGTCLETLEELMATFGFRYYNTQACYKMSKTLSMLADGRKAFAATLHFTDVPYPGFNDRGFCGPRQLSTMTFNITEPKHFEFIHSFLSGRRKIGMSITAKFEQKMANHAEENRLNMFINRDNKKKSFIKRIYLDMKNWHYSNGDPILPIKLFKSTEMPVVLEGAQKTLESIFGELKPCVCPTSKDLAYLINSLNGF